MPKYIVSSDTPISAVPINRPDLPEWPGGEPSHPWVPPGEGIWGGGVGGRPSHPIYPVLPPKDEWPPLPPLGELFPPGVALPIPPTPEHPMVPLPDDPDVDPPTVWPPVRPELPDMSGKSLVLALLYVSRHNPVWAWVVIDHEEAKAKLKEIIEKIKNRPHPEHPIAPGGGDEPTEPQPRGGMRRA